MEKGRTINKKEKKWGIFKKTDLYLLIEILLAIEITGKDHSEISCINCTGRLVTLDKCITKFKAAYESTRAQLRKHIDS